MLDHEQAAIVSQYRPKPIKGLRNNNNHNNKPNASRRHSSMVQSVRLSVQDIRRYSTIDAIRLSTGTLSTGTLPPPTNVHPHNDTGGVHEGFNNNDDYDENHNEPEAVSFIAAMENIHFRTLEGYFCWMQATGKVKSYSAMISTSTDEVTDLCKRRQKLSGVVRRNLTLPCHGIYIRACTALP